MVLTVCLDEKEHAVIMMHELKQMKQEDYLCDFTITVKSYEYRVHKAILSAGSPFFKAMFKHGTSENQAGKVEMKDVDSECVKSCIDFMYSGQFDIPDGKTRQLLHVAIMMQLEKVKEAIRSLLDKQLNAMNFYETRNIANMYNLQTLSTKCEKYFEENVIAISVQPGFIGEAKSFLLTLLKSKSFKLNEKEKLDIILKWAGETPERSGDLLELAKILKLEEVSSEYLSDLLDKHPLVSNNLHLYKLMSGHLVKNVKETAIQQKTFKDKDCKEMVILFDSTEDCLQSLNPESAEITKFHDETFCIHKNFSAISMDSYIYVLCDNKSVHRLDFKNKHSKWERLQSMMAYHGSYPPNASLSGSMVVIGSSGDPSKDAELYNPVLNQWIKLREKPLAVGGQTLVSLGDSVYCVGGRHENGYKGSFCKFTPSSSTWMDLEPMRNSRRWCGAVAVEQKIFVMGGKGSGGLAAVEHECYDVCSRQWTCLSPMIKNQSYSIAHHFKGWIFTVDCNGSSKHVEKYNIEKDTWIPVASTDIDQMKIYESVMVRF